jgi:hypothetical protein
MRTAAWIELGKPMGWESLEALGSTAYVHPGGSTWNEK